MNKKEIKNTMLGIIEKSGFKPYDVEDIGGYFIFEMDENTVTHFRVKGVWKHWKFGMWINDEDLEHTVQIFCQHDQCIDKFKPSRSDLLVEYSMEDIESCNGDVKNLYNLLDMLEVIKNHPFMCYYGYFGYTGTRFIPYFLKSQFRIHKELFEEYITRLLTLVYCAIKIPFLRMNKNIKSVKLINSDKEHPGWYDGFLYRLEVEMKNNIFKNDEELCKFIGKHFKDDRYFEYHKHEHGLIISWFYNGERVWISFD